MSTGKEIYIEEIKNRLRKIKEDNYKKGNVPAILKKMLIKEAEKEKREFVSKFKKEIKINVDKSKRKMIKKSRKKNRR